MRLGDGPNKGFLEQPHEDIELEVEVYGEDINPKAVEDAVKLSVEKYCSVYAMLKNSVNIRVRWKVLGKTDSEQK